MGLLEHRAKHELNLARRRRGFSDRAELRRVDKAVRRAVVHGVEQVERLDPEVQLRHAQRNLAVEREIWASWGGGLQCEAES